MSDATMKMWAWVVSIVMGICFIVRHKQLIQTHLEMLHPWPVSRLVNVTGLKTFVLVFRPDRVD